MKEEIFNQIVEMKTVSTRHEEQHFAHFDEQ